MNQVDVAIVGHLCLDIIPALAGPPAGGEPDERGWFRPGELVSVGPAQVRLGGCVANTGTALVRLGRRTRWFAPLGDDGVGKWTARLVSDLDRQLGCDLMLQPGLPGSYTIVISLPGRDRMFWHCPGVNATFSGADVSPDQLAGATVVHFGYPPAMPATFGDGGARLADWFVALRRQGRWTSLDMVMPDFRGASGRVDWSAWLRRVLPHTDLFCPSLDELLAMLDRPAYDALVRPPTNGSLASRLPRVEIAALADRLIQWGARIVAIKLGDCGLLLRSGPHIPPGLPEHWKNRTLWQPAIQVPVAGTTAAGDAAAAGLLAALCDRCEPEAAALLACAAGAASVAHPGGPAGLPAQSELLRRFQASV
jgi:sugar/nucleoside kinase (ribokinase family)